MIKTWRVKIPALTGSKMRRAYVYLPQGYKNDRRTRYPVLYMFDGHNVFWDDHATYGKSWGVGKYLDEHKIPLIVVAVECNHGLNGERLEEYSPFDFDDAHFGPHEGKGKLTMDWYVNYLKPLIDKRYRTLPDRAHTFIMGSSMGGLMSLYALLQYNHVFGGAAALSPSLWVSPKGIREMIRTLPLDKDTVLYMDYGEQELAAHKGMRQVFPAAAMALQKRGVLLTQRIVPGGEHCEACWEKQLHFAIGTLMYDREF